MIMERGNSVKLSCLLAYFRGSFSRYACALQHDRIDTIDVTIIPAFSSADRAHFPRKKMAKRKSERPAPAAKTLYSAPAPEKGFDIIELLAAAPDGLTSSEIAQRLGRSLSEIFRILVVMERRGWLRKNPMSDQYSVSYRVLEHAFRATPAQ